MENLPAKTLAENLARVQAHLKYEVAENARLREALHQIWLLADAEEPLSVTAGGIAQEALHQAHRHERSPELRDVRPGLYERDLPPGDHDI